MKQFNLDEYLANPSKKVVTRDGRSARIRCTDRKGKGQPIVALVETPDRDEEYVSTFREDGRWSTSGCASDLDLFFAPEKHEGWANIYGKFLACDIFSTKEEAEECVKRAGAKDFVATAKIEWEE